MIRRAAWLALTLLVAAVYGILLWLGNQHIFAGDPPLPPFDIRLGYTPAEARAYLVELHPVQAGLYAGLIRAVDTGFGVLFALWLWLTARGLGARRAAWLALPYLLTDLTENALVARMLAQGAGAADLLIQIASAATLAKFAALAIVLIVLGQLGLRRWGHL
ncbi:hypothetical protein SAMN06265173_13617 [Thalassovita litoralis]|jgi:hypothetical protein|uniref:Uncharacterized protein n=1 Tax=Thalassovita litoralis TaxID=1010611 RepID=A0A521FMJ5_9RHOB|nr:hypothetical protein [Thalassovita litoralis]SMO97392.1 hypothetical protein SAMN06265173_13617 [Thalassovita litoralis]